MGPCVNHKQICKDDHLKEVEVGAVLMAGEVIVDPARIKPPTEMEKTQEQL